MMFSPASCIIRNWRCIWTIVNSAAQFPHSHRYVYKQILWDSLISVTARMVYSHLKALPLSLEPHWTTQLPATFCCLGRASRDPLIFGLSSEPVFLTCALTSWPPAKTEILSP